MIIQGKESIRAHAKTFLEGFQLYANQIDKNGLMEKIKNSKAGNFNL